MIANENFRTVELMNILNLEPKMKMTNYYLNLSERILDKARLAEDTSSLRKEMFYIKCESLASRLTTDGVRNMFWGNIYNAYFLILKSENMEANNFFKIKRVRFSRFELSLNDIEFGILGTKKIKLGFYQFTNPLYPSYIKQLAVEKFDQNNLPHLLKNTINTSSEV
jgi:Protein of unknown function, DUF547